MPSAPSPSPSPATGHTTSASGTTNAQDAPVSLEAFLASVGMLKHLGTLTSTGFDDVADFVNMSAADLEACGSELKAQGVPPGHVGKILRAMALPPAVCGQKRDAEMPDANDEVKRPADAAAAVTASCATTGGTAASDGGCRVYVSKLKPAATEALIAQLFAACGPSTIDMTLNPSTGRCRGACFLTFESAAAATAALAMDGALVCGKAASVQRAI